MKTPVVDGERNGTGKPEWFSQKKKGEWYAWAELKSG